MGDIGRSLNHKTGEYSIHQGSNCQLCINRYASYFLKMSLQLVICR